MVHIFTFTWEKASEAGPTDEFGKRNPITSNEFGLGFWSVNFPKSNKEQDRASNVSPNCDIITEPAPTQYNTTNTIIICPSHKQYFLMQPNIVSLGYSR